MGILNRVKKNKDTEEKSDEKKVVAKATKTSDVSKFAGVDEADIIVKPLISEKSASLAGANQYVFVVQKNANRIQVRTAIKSLYGVSPLSINILNVRGKNMRFGRRMGKRNDWKKAIVTLPKGQTINVYEGV
ncbi:50S ribosomal protein L23 [Candidatus Uhrbacteria bacterium CG10_big_fil_rev_8_21_14_0_10_48_16]|uniref:Large ribosomal subunit protein uL23 n=1 Tax=Candidatus Uhrbacteria bacterium CG10_big_fil_rev_8_21_14_0_10_48_16 TaxID=1975038 RepID=A0A2M8LGU1_9BACT|nr:MAG: 50S ribosomal protein L23 [Candidatus Uhrbacteria bacterium CG10_big_fil_rev_8_21_14_0_10_48_16]